MVSLFTKYIAKKKLISINSGGANEDSQNRSVAGDGGGHNDFQWEGGKFPHQEEQLKIPKIDERKGVGYLELKVSWMML